VKNSLILLHVVVNPNPAAAFPRPPLVFWARQGHRAIAFRLVTLKKSERRQKILARVYKLDSLILLNSYYCFFFVFISVGLTL
jgi:hypothetical protein